MSKCDNCIKNDVCNYKLLFQSFEVRILSFEFKVKDVTNEAKITNFNEEKEHIDVDIKCKHFVTSERQRNVMSTYADTSRAMPL